jgi:UMF1 family MFS transporter
MPEAGKRRVISWCLFDFANSSYSAVISAVVFPVYYAGRIVGNEAGLGDLWWGRAVSLSMVVVALSSPFLGGVADYSGRRKRFLFFFTYLCISSVAMFSFLDEGMVLAGFMLAVLANIGMEGGVVFYNSFLPAIAPREKQGRASSWGFATGYAGSILSLLLAMPLVKAGDFGATWLMVSALFAVFSIPAFLFLPPDRKGGRVIEGLTRGLGYTWRTFKSVWAGKESRRFLIAYLIYEEGVSTVIVFSSLFAASTLGFRPEELVLLYLFIQATALVGAFVMARPVDFRGPKKVVSYSLAVWTAVCIAAFFVDSKTDFWYLASTAGLALGTVQAASRAFFAQFIPEGQESEYFGAYSMAGKSSAVIGPLVFGHVSSAFGSQRPAILSVAFFFLVGLLIVLTSKAGGPNVRERKQ